MVVCAAWFFSGNVLAQTVNECSQSVVKNEYITGCSEQYASWLRLELPDEHPNNSLLDDRQGIAQKFLDAESEIRLKGSDLCPARPSRFVSNVYLDLQAKPVCVYEFVFIQS